MFPPFRQFSDEPIGPNRFGRSIQLVVFEPTGVQRHVVAQRVRKQENVLQDDADVLTQSLQGVFLNGLPIDEDAPLLVDVESVEQIDDGGFARTCGTNKGHRLPGFDPERHILQHPFFIRVSKPNVFKLNGPPQLNGLLGCTSHSRVFDALLAGQQLEHPV